MEQSTIGLIQQAQNGDKQAFEKLFKLYSLKLEVYVMAQCFKYPNYFINSYLDEIVQETMIQVWKYLYTLKEPKYFKKCMY